jgi:hypothetical protein
MSDQVCFIWRLVSLLSEIALLRALSWTLRILARSPGYFFSTGWVIRTILRNPSLFTAVADSLAPELIAHLFSPFIPSVYTLIAPLGIFSAPAINPGREYPCYSKEDL